MATQNQERKTTTIDAAGKAIGRVASSAAIALQGKNRPAFVPHEDNGDIVEIRNIAKLKITGKKLEQKAHYRYSGYPGGMKKTLLKETIEKNPKRAIELAVSRMLPKNRLRSVRMKRLIIHND